MLLALCCLQFPVIAQEITGELKVWHKVTLTFDGPFASEAGAINPFSDFRLVVNFIHDSVSYRVPGYFSADGSAGETGATAGNRWRVHFAPDRPGDWSYQVEFHEGADIALQEDGGNAVFPHGTEGMFTVMPTDKNDPDFRSKGRLAYVGKRYLQHLGTGTCFLKTGADAPETFLAFHDFDQTSMLSGGSPVKSWAPHLQDWREGDPVWRDSLGKGIIGAVNYLASEEQNALSFLTMNLAGDGRNVWPFMDSLNLDRYDCSKLDQWEVVFTHCDRKGIFLHFKTQEEENDQLLDNGELGRNRTLYYRELIARFGHHLGLNWNLGEENTNTEAQRKEFAAYFEQHDPYRHAIVIHTFPGSDEFVYTPLLGDQSALTGASLQADWDDVHALTLEWVSKSTDTGKPWIVSNDEQGPAFIGVPDDSFTGSPSQHDIRSSVLWGNLMAGGAGVEYFFGYALPHNDLNCEDFRSRDRMWDYNRIARQFFEAYVKFPDMLNADSLLSGQSAMSYCFTDLNSQYLIYLGSGGAAVLDMSDTDGVFEVFWLNPREGGALISGDVQYISGGQKSPLGPPPADAHLDWVILLERTGLPDFAMALNCAPFSESTSMLWWQIPPGADLDEISIEKSIDGIQFVPLEPQPEISCGAYCNARVPCDGSPVFFRLKQGSQQVFSRVVQCSGICSDHAQDTSAEPFPQPDQTTGN